MTQQQLSLVHLVREPTVSVEGTPPLLLLLHGIGSYEGDLMGLAPYLDGRLFVVGARAPFTLGPGSFAWYRVDFSDPERRLPDPEEAVRSRDLLLGFVSELVARYRLDPRRVFLAGFSQGAIMSLGAALARPDLFAGVVLMSGRALPELTSRAAPAEQMEGLPFLVVHGTRDEVLPVQNGREIRALLERLPVRLTYEEFDMGHQVSEESLETVSEWLTARLDEVPASDY